MAATEHVSTKSPLPEEEYVVDRITQPPSSPDIALDSQPPLPGPAVMSDFVENLIDSAINSRDTDSHVNETEINPNTQRPSTTSPSKDSAQEPVTSTAPEEQNHNTEEEEENGGGEKDEEEEKVEEITQATQTEEVLSESECGKVDEEQEEDKDGSCEKNNIGSENVSDNVEMEERGETDSKVEEEQEKQEQEEQHQEEEQEEGEEEQQKKEKEEEEREGTKDLEVEDVENDSVILEKVMPENNTDGDMINDKTSEQEDNNEMDKSQDNPEPIVVSVEEGDKQETGDKKCNVVEITPPAEQNGVEEDNNAEGEDSAPRVLGSIHGLGSNYEPASATKWIVNSEGELVPMTENSKPSENFLDPSNDTTPWTVDPSHPSAQREVSFLEVMQMWKEGSCPIYNCTSSGSDIDDDAKASHFERVHMEFRLVYICPYPICPGRDEHYEAPDLQNMVRHMKSSSHGTSDKDAKRLTGNLMPRKILNPGFVPPVLDQGKGGVVAPTVVLPRDETAIEEGHEALQYEDFNAADGKEDDINNFLHYSAEAVRIWQTSKRCPVYDCEASTLGLKRHFEWHWYVTHEPRIKVYYCPVDGCQRSGGNWCSRRRRDLTAHLKQRHHLKVMPEAIATQVVRNPEYVPPDKLNTQVKQEKATPKKAEKKSDEALMTEAENTGGVLEVVDDSVPEEFEMAWEAEKRCPCENCPIAKINFRADFQRHWKEHHVKLSSFYVCPDSNCEVKIGDKVMHYRSREWRQVVHHLMGATHSLSRTEAEQVGAALVPHHLDNPMYIPPKLRAKHRAPPEKPTRDLRHERAQRAEKTTVDYLGEQISPSELAAFESSNANDNIPQEFLILFKVGKGCPSYNCTAGSCKFRIAELGRHWKSKHVKIVPHYQCPIDVCEFSTKRKKNLLVHIENKHGKSHRVAQGMVERCIAVYAENADYEAAVLPKKAKQDPPPKPKPSPVKGKPPTLVKEPTPTKRKAAESPAPAKKAQKKDPPATPSRTPSSGTKGPACTAEDLKFFDSDTKDHVPAEFYSLFKPGEGCVSVGCNSEHSHLSVSDLIRHWKSAHIEIIPMFKCHLDDCTHKYKSQKGLKAHLEKSHRLKQKTAITLTRAARAVFAENPNYSKPVLPKKFKGKHGTPAKSQEVEEVSKAVSRKRRASETEDTPPSKLRATEQDKSLQPKVRLMALPAAVQTPDPVHATCLSGKDILKTGNKQWVIPRRSSRGAAGGPQPMSHSTPKPSSSSKTDSVFEGVDVAFETFDDDDDDDTGFNIEIPMPSLEDAGLGTSASTPKSPKAQQSLLSGVASLVTNLTRKQSEMEKQLQNQGTRGVDSEVLATITSLQSQNEALRFQVQALRQQLKSGEMAETWQKEKETMQQQLKEKDVTIRTLQDVVARFMNQPQTPNVMNQMFHLPSQGGEVRQPAAVTAPPPRSPSPRMMIKPRSGHAKSSGSQRCSVTLSSGDNVDFEYSSFADFMQKIGTLTDQHGLAENQ